MNQEIQDLLYKLKGIKDEVEYLSNVLPLRKSPEFLLFHKEDIDKAYDALCGEKEEQK